jgi:hypothetical protein
MLPNYRPVRLYIFSSNGGGWKQKTEACKAGCLEKKHARTSCFIVSCKRNCRQVEILQLDALEAWNSYSRILQRADTMCAWEKVQRSAVRRT